jgi:hypothetical protein
MFTLIHSSGDWLSLYRQLVLCYYYSSTVINNKTKIMNKFVGISSKQLPEDGSGTNIALRIYNILVPKAIDKREL